MIYLVQVEQVRSRLTGVDSLTPLLRQDEEALRRQENRQGNGR